MPSEPSRAKQDNAKGSKIDLTSLTDMLQDVNWIFRRMDLSKNKFDKSLGQAKQSLYIGMCRDQKIKQINAISNADITKTQRLRLEKKIKEIQREKQIRQVIKPPGIEASGKVDMNPGSEKQDLG